MIYNNDYLQNNKVIQNITKPIYKMAFRNKKELLKLKGFIDYIIGKKLSNLLFKDPMFINKRVLRFLVRELLSFYQCNPNEDTDLSFQQLIKTTLYLLGINLINIHKYHTAFKNIQKYELNKEYIFKG